MLTCFTGGCCACWAISLVGALILNLQSVLLEDCKTFTVWAQGYESHQVYLLGKSNELCVTRQNVSNRKLLAYRFDQYEFQCAKQRSDTSRFSQLPSAQLTYQQGRLYEGLSLLSPQIRFPKKGEHAAAENPCLRNSSLKRFCAKLSQQSNISGLRHRPWS